MHGIWKQPKYCQILMEARLDKQVAFCFGFLTLDE
jgi:hypothetical protein